MGGNLLFVNIGVDAVTLLSTDESRIYFFSTDIGYDIRERINNNRIMIVNDSYIELPYILDATPSVFGRTFSDFESYLQFLAKNIGSKIKSRKVVVWFSGGKDSTASLIVLLGLQRYVDFHLEAYYMHVPLLDGERNLRFVDVISRRLNIEISIESIGRHKMKDLLEYFGIPYRGFRWCTYHSKIKPMRKIKRIRSFDYEVSSERIFESYKRFSSLLEYARRKMFISGKQLKPTYLFTIMDVVDIVKKRNVVHPDYLAGCSRVSCSICPYRTIFELKKTMDDLEDPGLIDNALRKTYLARYKDMVDFEEYMVYALWRFSPRIADKILALKKLVRESEQCLRSGDVHRMISSIWLSKFESPIIEVDKAISLMQDAYKKRRFGILNLGLEPNFMVKT